MRNPPGDPDAECLLILEEDNEVNAVEAVLEDNGEFICIDDI